MPVFHRETKRDLFYLDDLVLDLSAGGDGDLDCLAGLVAQQRLADRGLVGDGGHIVAGLTELMMR